MTTSATHSRRGLAALTVAILAGCAPNGAPVADPRPAPGTWIEVVPGGDTTCARGSEYRFFVRGGRSDRLIIDFQGGGACWEALGCSISDSLFRDHTGTLDEFVAAIDQGEVAGIFADDPGAPFADWTIIHVRYCTGDIHWGDASHDYGGGLQIEHRGYVNASAALDWVYQHYRRPQTILVSGCSAGAYGAILHGAYVAQHYADAEVELRLAVLADSGAGIVTDDFLMHSLPVWNARPNLPPFIDALQGPLAELALPDLYAAVAEQFPQHRFAQTSTAYDADQIFYYTAMGGAAADWPDAFRASIAALEASVPNFRAYIAPGPMHCVSPYPFFATREVDGVKLSDWTEQLVLGPALPENVACHGQACCEDPVCEACETAEADAWCRFCEGWPPPFSGCSDAP